MRLTQSLTETKETEMPRQMTTQSAVFPMRLPLDQHVDSFLGRIQLVVDVTESVNSPRQVGIERESAFSCLLGSAPQTRLLQSKSIPKEN